MLACPTWQDEGHKIKNPKMQVREQCRLGSVALPHLTSFSFAACYTPVEPWPTCTHAAVLLSILQLRAHLDAIPAAMRLIISGTPIQVDWVPVGKACDCMV